MIETKSETHRIVLACLPFFFEFSDIDVAQRSPPSVQNTKGADLRIQSKNVVGDLTDGMCEKSRSYASATALDIASFADMENAGGNCRSWDRIKGQKI